MDSKTEKTRKEFFKNCKSVAKAPACIFLEGNRFSQKAKVLPIPLYAYAGIEETKTKKFEYIEYNSDYKVYASVMESFRGSTEKARKLLEGEQIDLYFNKFKEDAFFKNSTPSAFWPAHRIWYYPLFLNKYLRNDIIKRGKDPKDKYYEKPEGCFRLKVWSDIPFETDLSENSAVATASATAIFRWLIKNKEEAKERFCKLDNLRNVLSEEAIVNFDFMWIFCKAASLDFFSNGAAVFASLLGWNRDQEVINFENLVYDELKDFLEIKCIMAPRPGENKKDYSKRASSILKNLLSGEDRQEKKKETDYPTNKHIQAYFDKFKYENLFSRIFKAEPLFSWGYEKLSFKDNDNLVLSIIKNFFRPVIVKNRFFGEPCNPNIKTWMISKEVFAMLGDPKSIALCETYPEKHLFNSDKEFKMSNYEVIYNSRKQGWGSKGANLVEYKGELEREKPIEPEAEKAEINFTETEVQISGQEPLSKDMPLILAEYIILEEKVHWLWSFVILPIFDTKKPKWQFRNYVSKKRAILKKNGIRITALKKANDDYAIFEGVEDGAKSNIQDIKKYYYRAISLFNEDNLNDAIKELSKISASYYKWYSFTDAYVRLAELIRMVNFEGISEKLITDCRDFLNWYNKRLRIGISRIELYRKQLLKNRLDELAEQEFQKIKGELKKVEDNFQALVQKVPLSKEDEDYEVFANFLIDAQEKLMFIQEQEAETEETRQEACIQAVIELQKENKYLNEIVKNALKVMGNELYRLDKSKTYSDKILRDESREIYWLVSELILDLKNFDEIELNKGNKLGMLMDYFNKGTESKIKKWLSGALDFKFRT